MKDRIKAIREAEGISQNDFARRIGVTPGFISNVETGRSGLSEEKILAAVESFHVSEEWLRTGKGDMYPFKAETKPEDLEGIGSRIRKIRKAKEMTQDKFAKEIGVHKNSLIAAETGKSVPSKAFVNRLVRAFNISYDWLMTGEGDMENRERVDQDLIEWLNKHPEVLRERAGMYGGRLD